MPGPVGRRRRPSTRSIQPIGPVVKVSDPGRTYKSVPAIGKALAPPSGGPRSAGGLSRDPSRPRPGEGAKRRGRGIAAAANDNPRRVAAGLRKIEDRRPDKKHPVQRAKASNAASWRRFDKNQAALDRADRRPKGRKKSPPGIHRDVPDTKPAPTKDRGQSERIRPLPEGLRRRRKVTPPVRRRRRRRKPAD